MLAAPLPAPASLTIGREGELAEIGALLTRPDVRLVTLTGRRRRGQDAARARGRPHAREPLPRRHGLRRPRRGRRRQRSCPRRRRRCGVVAATQAELGERLARVTRGADTLLVLDGFERFLADAAEVAQLLAAVPNLTVLATSRAPLRLTAEHTYRVQPLAVSNAAALFRARVAASRSDWAPADDDRVVADICARLDGLPLAIELAADRARWLPLPALLERLEQRLELLELRAARPAGTPALAARDAGMVVGGARAGPAARARAAVRVRGRRLARGLPRRLQRRGRAGRGAAGRDHGQDVADRRGGRRGRAAAAGDARHRARVRRRAARRGASGRCCSSATPTTS